MRATRFTTWQRGVARGETHSLRAMFLLLLVAHCVVVSAQHPPPPPREGPADASRTVPDFVTRHAPLVWLHSLDPFRPSDLLTHVRHTTPMVDQKPLPDLPPMTLDNLALLNDRGAVPVALTSNDDVTTLPSWLLGDVPDETGKTANATSCVVILVEKSPDQVDAFYFYFYSEHNMVRFYKGKPVGIYYSQHEDGAAYAWTHMGISLKHERPLVFSAYGSHANYASDGDHIHDGALVDYCDAGILWDPVSSAYFYRFDAESSQLTRIFSAAPSTPHDSNLTSFLYFTGLWGDAQYPDEHPLQKTVPYFGLKRFVSGPRGPMAKQLVRRGLFPDNRGRKSWIQWAVGVFMMWYPCCIRGWRKWISSLVLLATSLVGVLALRHVVTRYRRRKGYKRLEMEIPLSDREHEA
ncbi:hypothetical protein E4U43_005876 [Claviceps pusilla]|uniref:Vacuolar protein sorting-associated protein 62 n=1 Tax=Claviceps pusilla TaxID=123648 RepID=A0A9P7NE85_9HYPO|nr:hypothetical protein E4U43_005876 [Claviceps pusilla]